MGRTSQRNTDKLLNTKLMLPRLHAAAIQRPELLARLDAGRAKKLTLVTAPTGFGARNNAARAGLWMNFRRGNASDMPFEDKTFDFTFCQAAFKNFSQPVRAIAEMHRVLRPGGTSVIVDMRSDASSDEIEREIKGMHLGRVDEWMTRWTFKQMLLKSAYSVPQMESMIAQTPFGRGRIDVSGVGFQVWLEKR